MYFFSNNGAILLSLAGLMLFIGEVASHGHMQKPDIRIAPGDENNGLTITRGPTRTQPCAGNAPGAVKNTFAAGSSMPITWEIGAAHQGSCFVEISTTPDTNFQVLKEFPNCADTNGVFSDTVPLPSNVSCDHCTIRWRWEAKLTGELYLDCADVKITGSGSQAPAVNPVSKESTNSTNATNTTETTTSATADTTETTTSATADTTETTSSAAASTTETTTVQPDVATNTTITTSTDCIPTSTGTVNAGKHTNKGRHRSHRHTKKGRQGKRYVI